MWTALINRHVFDYFGAPQTPSQFFGPLKFLIFSRFLSMVQFFGSAKIIIFTIFKLVPILWVSQYLSTIRYAIFFTAEGSAIQAAVPKGKYCTRLSESGKAQNWEKFDPERRLFLTSFLLA